MAGNTADALKLKEEGNEFYRKKDYDQAIACYGRAIELAPESECAALCYSNRSAVFQVQKKYVKAEKDAQACLTIKPDFVRGYARLAQSQRKQQKFEAAAKTINDGLTRAPDDPELKKGLQAIEKAQKKNDNKTAAVSQVDEQSKAALVQTFDELDKSAMSFEGERKETAMRVEQAHRTIISKTNVLKLLDGVPEDCSVYNAVGKMYLRSSTIDTKALLKRKIAAAEETKKTFGKKQAYLRNQIDSIQSEKEKILKVLRPKKE